VTPEECRIGMRVSAFDSAALLRGEVIDKADIVASVRWDNGIVGDPSYTVLHAGEDGPWREPTPCPECGYPIREKWSGVECTHCDWWFCL
jgi:hypothetical protein